MAKSRYTYDQFRKSAQDSGLLGQFSPVSYTHLTLPTILRV